MMQKAYFLVCGTVFCVIAAAHLTRLVVGWDISIAGWAAPHWVSVPGLILSGLLSTWGFTLASRRRTTA